MTQLIIPATGQPNFRVYRNAAQTLTSAVFTKINFDTRFFDSGNFFDITTNHRFQPTVPGTYVIGSNIVTGGINAAGQFAETAIYKNGSQYSAPGELIAFQSGNGMATSAFDLVQLNGSTDFVEIFVISSAPTPTVSTGSTNAVMWGYRIGP